jgi:hypothetical protein
VEGSGRGPILRNYPGIRLEGLTKTTKPKQDSPSSDLDFNSGAPEYEVDLLNTRPLRSMSHTVLVTSNRSQVMDDSNIKCESNLLHDVFNN